MRLRKKIFVVVFCVWVFLPGFQVARAGNYSVNFKSQQSSVSNLWPSNIFRNGSLFGQSISAQSKTYGPDFAAFGTKYQEIAMGNAANDGLDMMDKISPSSGVYDFTKIDATVNDVLAMGFKPFVRYFAPPAWVASDNIAMLNNPALQAKTIAVYYDITKHLSDKYGVRTLDWAFSSSNEICPCETNLGATQSDWSKPTQKLVDYYYAFANKLHSIDPNLRVSGGIESVDAGAPYQLWYYVNYLISSGQKNKLAAFNFLDFHHYGRMQQGGDTDTILDNASLVFSDVKKIKDLLSSNGFGNIEIWESERGFNGYGQQDETRDASTIGGTWLALDAVSSAAGGTNNFFIWYEIGWPGLREWLEPPIHPSYYGMYTLYNTVGFNSSATFYGSSSDTGTVNAYGIKNAQGQKFILVFNRRSVADAGNFTVILPDNFSTSATLHVYKYSASRVVDAPREFTAIGPLKIQTLGGNNTITFSQSIDPYSMTAFMVEEATTAKKADLSTCAAANECQSNICLDGYCGLKPNGWGCLGNNVCSSGLCKNGTCAAICVSQNCSSLGNYACGSWSDGCGGTISCGVCASNQSCSNGTCVSSCTSHVSKKCDSGNLYWYNSCNAKEELAQDCGADTATSNYQCHANWLWRDIIKKGCSDGACYATDTWLNDTDCSVSTKTCRSGACVSNANATDLANLPAVNITANGSQDSISIDTAGPVTLAWTATNADTCRAFGDWDGNLATSGSQTLASATSKTYTVTCSNSSGSASASVKVNVQANTNTNTNTDTVTQKPVTQMTRAELLAAITRIQALIVDLQKKLLALTGGKTVYSCGRIDKNLFYGMQNDPQAVRCLQEVLESQGYAVTASGNYDVATKSAVAQFQQKYTSEILAPYHLTRGSGNVGNSTRTKINQIINGNNF